MQDFFFLIFYRAQIIIFFAFYFHSPFQYMNFYEFLEKKIVFFSFFKVFLICETEGK